MAKGFFIETQGVSKLIRSLSNKSQALERMVQAEIADTAQAIERRAVQYAPNDASVLRQSIKAEQETANQWQVVAQTRYAAYIEFGTKKKVQIPAGLESYAAQFQGKSGTGTFKEMVRNIYEWMRRKGIKGEADRTVIKSGKNKGKTRVTRTDQTVADLALAYQIARSILTNGIKPKPFFFPAYNQETDKLRKRLLGELKKAIRTR